MRTDMPFMEFSFPTSSFLFVPNITAKMNRELKKKSKSTRLEFVKTIQSVIARGACMRHKSTSIWHNMELFEHTNEWNISHGLAISRLLKILEQHLAGNIVSVPTITNNYIFYYSCQKDNSLNQIWMIIK